MNICVGFDLIFDQIRKRVLSILYSYKPLKICMAGGRV